MAVCIVRSSSVAGRWGGGPAAEPTRPGGSIVPDPHTTNAIAALSGTQPLRRSGWNTLKYRSIGMFLPTLRPAPTTL